MPFHALIETYGAIQILLLLLLFNRAYSTCNNLIGLNLHALFAKRFLMQVRVGELMHVCCISARPVYSIEKMEIKIHSL